MIRHLETERRRPADRAIKLEIAPAHPGGSYFEDDFARLGDGIGEVQDFYPAVAREDHALHVLSYPIKALVAVRRSEGEGDYFLQLGAFVSRIPVAALA
jgi:hypothetical protein